MSHAHLYIADHPDHAPLPEDVRTQGADVEHFVLAAFGIDEARRLKERAHVLPLTRPTRDFLVSFNSTTVEAQNALLKLFEDPPPCAVFHVVLSREDALIPTLRSRLVVAGTQTAARAHSDFDAFARMTYKERIAEITARTKEKDTAWGEAIVAGAEALALREAARGASEALQSVAFVRRYFGARGASAKMLLEELALSLPVLK